MMKIHYNVTGAERKRMAQVIGRMIDAEPVYMKVPTCAYKIGSITVEKDGTLAWGEEIDNDTIRKVMEALTTEGFTATDIPMLEPEPETAADMEPVELTVSVPIGRHTGKSLRNLVNLIYTRAGLINKALGTGFAAEQGLVDAMGENEGLHTAEDFRRAVAAYEEEHGLALSGITITPEEIRFSSLPETTDQDRVKAFTELTAMMNKQALDQKRIQAKAVNEDNEKYALRVWLTRLGMKGAEYKTTRKILLENLSGHSAFRTEAEKERWTQRHAEKREAARVDREVTEA